jgi:hypothetical protein
MATSHQEDNTMASEAQRNAIAKYKHEWQRQFAFAVQKKTRPKMIEYLDSIENKQGYLRHLVAMDMKSKGIETDGLDGETEEDPGICPAEDCT